MAYKDMYKQLLQAVQIGTVDAVRQAASRIFESAVSVTDTSFRVLSADADPGSTDDMLEKNGDQVYVSRELLELFKEHDLISNMSARPHETIVVDWGYFKDHPHLTSGVFWEDNILGTITVLVDSAAYSPEQAEAMQACADALAIVLHHSEEGKKEMSSDRDQFISRLFHGSAAQKDLIHAEQNHFFRRSGSYVVLATEFIPDPAWREASSRNTGVLIYRNAGITYLMAGAGSRELREMQEWIENRGHRYGLSYPFGNPLLTEKMAKQASAVLDFGSRSAEKKAEWKFSEYALDMLVKSSPDAACLIHPGILEMEQYDARNNTEYLATLKAWLRHRMDYSETAKAMNLHRNSLYYRMQRISELFGIDLADMNTEVQLYLTLWSNNLF